MEGKIEDKEMKLAKCVETQCERQGVLLREDGERIRSLEADHGQVGPVSRGEVGGLHDAGVCMPSLGRGRSREVSWPSAGPQCDCSGGCAECEFDGMGE